MTNHQDRRRLNSALYVPCSLVQLARVVVCVRVLVDVTGVMVVVLIGRHTVSAILVAIFVVIFTTSVMSKWYESYCYTWRRKKSQGS